MAKRLPTERPMADRPNEASSSIAGKAEAPALEAEVQTQTTSTAPSFPGGLRQAFIIIALMLGIFLVGLDLSIIATAIPTITKDFHTVEQVGWYGSAFFMCLAMFQGFWGKAYKFFPQKSVFLSCILIFELGSMINALAPNSAALITGRAVQGLGGAGIGSGCYIIAAYTVQPSRLPMVTGLFGVIYACAAALGPVLGGIFTQELTWRWCFWVNLPIGGATFLFILLIFHTPPNSRFGEAPSYKQWPREFDALGVVVGLCAWICLLLVLQTGGTEHAWNSSFSIGLLVGFWLLVVAFVVAEWKQGDNAMIPVRLLKSRTIAACAVYLFLANSGGLSRNYTLPIYFQAVQGVSPSTSGVRTLPSVLSVSITSFISSIMLGMIGYYQPFLWVGGILMTVGSGLYYILDLHSSAGSWIGYQVVAGVGIGMVIQLPIIVAQKISAKQDMSVTVGIMLFANLVGGGLGISTGQAILINRLIDSLPVGNPNITAAHVLAVGAATLRQAFSNSQDLTVVVTSYMTGLKAAWVFSIAMSGAAFVTAFAGEWRSINKPPASVEAPIKPPPATMEVKA